jgi:predicted transcriptional regulator
VGETALVSCEKRKTRLTQAEVGLLLQLHKDGLTQAQIAQRFGITQQAVSKWLDATTDTTDTAKLYLRGSALRMAQNIVKKGRAADHVAALKGLSVLTEERSAGLVVQIGVKDSDVTIHLSPPGLPAGGERTQNP